MDDSDPGASPDPPGAVIIPCVDETAARAEAARQQLEEVHGADWIYLRIEGQWVAKRYVKESEPPEKKTWKQRLGSLGAELLDPGNWIGP